MPRPKHVVLDTDLGNDIDDLVAITLLHGLQAEGKIHIDAMLSSKNDVESARFIDFYNAFLGRQYPVGTVTGGVTNQRQYLHLLPFLREKFPEVSKLTRPVFPDAVTLLLQRLRAHAAAGTELELVLIGFSTNIAHLLDHSEGAELLNRVCPRITMMAGDFKTGKREYNIYSDEASFRTVLAKYQGEIVFCGWELGISLPFAADDILRLWQRGQNMPLWYTYFGFSFVPHNRPNFDPITVLQASGYYDDCFELSPDGTVELTRDQMTMFRPEVGGRHRFLTIRREKRTFVSREISRLVCDVV